MKFIVVTIEWMSAHGLTPLPTMRKSKDGSKVILHEDYFNLIAKRDEEGNLLLDGAEVYAHNSIELQNLLSSDEWSYSEEDAPTENTDFIQVAAVRNLMTATKAGIQTMNLTNEEALAVKDMYPNWAEGLEVKTGEKYNHNGDLWEVVQDHTTQANWAPSMDTLSLWKKVDVEHAGTKEDPIPFEQGMSLEKDKYYSQYDMVYLCIQNANAVVYDLKDIPAIVTPINE